MGKLSRYDVTGEAEKKKKSHRASTLPKSSTGKTIKKSRSASNRLRDAKRALGRVKNDEAKAHLENKMVRIQGRLEDNERARKAKALGERNRKYQFLDTKRVEKKLKRCTGEEEMLSLQADLYYVKNFHVGEKYLGLFDEKLGQARREERDVMRMHAKEAVIRKKATGKDGESSDGEGEIKDDFFTKGEKVVLKVRSEEEDRDESENDEDEEDKDEEDEDEKDEDVQESDDE